MLDTLFWKLDFLNLTRNLRVSSKWKVLSYKDKNQKIKIKNGEIIEMIEYEIIKITSNYISPIF